MMRNAIVQPDGRSVQRTALRSTDHHFVRELVHELQAELAGSSDHDGGSGDLRDLGTSDAFARVWKERRQPLPLETSTPGVFAAGDLRSGAMNRVASAVGEGSMVVRLAHEYLSLI